MSDPDGGMLSWDETVFRDESVFEIDHVPDRFPHRDSQLEQLQYVLRPAVRGSRPLSAVVSGPPGTGKTTAIQTLFADLDGRSGVRPVRVNCQVNSTRYSVFARLFEAVKGYEPPASGISFKEVFGDTIETVVDDAVLVVALDDVNYLFYEDEASDTLYSLLRAHEEESGAKVGVIVVSSDPDLDVLAGLDSRVQSVFRPENVYFPVYDEAEIVGILRARAERGFREGVIDPPVLDRTAARTAETGDLRVGIDLLRRAGLRAESQGRTTITTDDVESAYGTSKYLHLSRSLASLSAPERALVAVIADHDGEAAGTVYDAFHGATGLGYTRYSEIVNKLEELGVIEAEYGGVEGRGRSRSLSLAYDREAVVERLED